MKDRTPLEGGRSIYARLQGFLRSPPSEWCAAFHQHNAIILFALLIVIGVAGFARFVFADGLGTEIPLPGLACGCFGTAGVGIVGIVHARMHSQLRQFQTTSFLLTTAANMLICAGIGSLVDEEIRQVGLVRQSLTGKFMVVMFGWSPKVTLAWIAISLLTICTTQILAFPLEDKPGSVGYMVTDVLYTFAAALLALSYNHVLQQLYSVHLTSQGDMTAFRQVMRLTCDGEVWVTFDDADALVIEKADPQFQDLVGRPVNRHQSLIEFMKDTQEYDRVKDAVRGTTAVAPLLHPTTFDDGHGQPLQAELLVVRWHGQLGSRGTSKGLTVPQETSGENHPVYLIGVRLSVGTVTMPVASLEYTPMMHRFSPAESMGSVGSVLPHIQGSENSDRPSSTPASSYVTKSNGTSDVFQHGLVDLSSIVRLGIKEHWLIEMEELELLPDRVLGKGGFGIVIEALYYGAPLAAKITKTAATMALKDSKRASGLIHELRMLRRARHPNIVPFYGASIEISSREIVLVFEKIIAPTLGPFVLEAHDKISGSRDASREPQNLVKILVDLARALSYLHARKPAMVHGDLKPANVFVSKNKEGEAHVFLADFGLSRSITCALPMGFTKRWAAPEVMMNAVTPSTVQDVFSYGRVMSFIITGQAPLHQHTESDIDRILKSGLALPAPQWPDSALSIVCSPLADECLRLDTHDRPTMKDLSKQMECVPQALEMLERGELPNQVVEGSASSSMPFSQVLPGASGKLCTGSSTAQQVKRVEISQDASDKDLWLQSLERARASALSKDSDLK
eukprot:gb/GFBE01013764.1/.p1 GENE.gb/GFBE01013764.1/~~gb/GFBE01013764.1/.p1  ORF type:complete len:795 (+),score=87.12 gb/GFBE01013764.1/:1-2385(+)